MTDLTEVTKMTHKEVAEFKELLYGGREAPKEEARGFPDLEEKLQQKQSPQDESAGERR